MATWPSTLPNPQLSDYSVSPEQAFISTQMDAGTKRYRQKFTNVPDGVQMTFHLTVAQMAIFRAFWRNTIHHGSDWFACSCIDLGAGFATYNVHAKRPYTARFVNDSFWAVAMEVEVEIV